VLLKCVLEVISEMAPSITVHFTVAQQIVDIIADGIAVVIVPSTSNEWTWVHPEIASVPLIALIFIVWLNVSSLCTYMR
jgi:hypothetical protein